MAIETCMLCVLFHKKFSGKWASTRDEVEHVEMLHSARPKFSIFNVTGMVEGVLMKGSVITVYSTTADSRDKLKYV